MITEFCAFGNLRDFLKCRRPPDSGYERPLTNPGGQVCGALTGQHLVSFAYQVSRGMDFMSSKKVRLKVHICKQHRKEFFLNYQ